MFTYCKHAKYYCYLRTFITELRLNSEENSISVINIYKKRNVNGIIYSFCNWKTTSTAVDADSFLFGSQINVNNQTMAAFTEEYSNYVSNLKSAVKALISPQLLAGHEVVSLDHVDNIEEGLTKILGLTSNFLGDCKKFRVSKHCSARQKEVLSGMQTLPNTLKATHLHTKLLPVHSKSNTGPVQFTSTDTSNKRKRDTALDLEDECDSRDEIKSDFIREGDWVTVFVDGSCLDNGKSKARAGLGVWFNTNSPFNLAEPVQGRRTNNVAELEASIRAIEQAHAAGVKKLRIKTDSMFLINCVTKWRFAWMKNGWVTSAKQPVINKTEVINIGLVMDRLPVEIDWVHVKAHSNIIGNEAADFLAKQGAEKCV